MSTLEHNYESDAERRLREQDNAKREQQAEADREFDHLHAKGAKQFGMRWLSMNMWLSGLRFLPFLPQNDRRIDTLITQAVYTVLEKLQQRRLFTDDERAFMTSMRNSVGVFPDKNDYSAEEVGKLIALIDKLSDKPQGVAEQVIVAPFIIPEVEPEPESKPCDYCGGTFMQSCPSCNGTGEQGDEGRQCFWCGGEGLVTCTHCGNY